MGFQIFFEKSFEHGENKGLSILDGEFVPLNQKNKNLIIPHVGWNQCDIVNKKNKLFDGIENNSDFYFTHSYYADPENKNIISSTANYDGFRYCSSITKDNIFATQFHPEKSSITGLKMYNNFRNFCLS